MFKNAYHNISKQYIWLTAGLLFALFWASAATATKIGLFAAQPLVIAVVRFGIAGSLMLMVAHLVRGYRLPAKKEWTQLTIYGFLNITVYLGLYVIAMQQVTAGVSALTIAINPVFISFLSLIFLKQKISRNVLLAIVIGIAGIVCAAWPMFRHATVTRGGLLLLLFSMLSYSAGAVYFAANKWNDLHLLTINGWQTLIGGSLLVPFSLFYYKGTQNHFNTTFWSAVLWLAVPVSIVAVQLWLWLLKTNTIKAGLWLFLCPVFGFAIAAWMMNDVISWFTIAGLFLVMLALFLSQKEEKNENSIAFFVAVACYCHRTIVGCKNLFG